MTTSSSAKKTTKRRVPKQSAGAENRTNDVTQKLLAISGSNQSGSEAIRAIVAGLKELVPFEAATVYRVYQERDEMRPVYDEGERVESLDFVSIGSGGGLTGWSAETAKPILLADRTRMTTYHPDTDFASFLSVPITIKDRVVAILNFGSRTAHALSKDHSGYLDQLLLPLAFSLENVFLKEDLRRLQKSRADIEKSLLQSRDSSAATQSLMTIIDLATETNHIVNEALSVIVGNVQCLLLENAASNQKGIARLRRVEQAAMNINECNRKLLRMAALVEKASRPTRRE